MEARLGQLHRPRAMRAYVFLDHRATTSVAAVMQLLEYPLRRPQRRYGVREPRRDLREIRCQRRALLAPSLPRWRRWLPQCATHRIAAHAAQRRDLANAQALLPEGMKVHPSLRTTDSEPSCRACVDNRILQVGSARSGAPARLGGGSALTRRKWVHLIPAPTHVTKSAFFRQCSD